MQLQRLLGSTTVRPLSKTGVDTSFEIIRIFNPLHALPRVTNTSGETSHRENELERAMYSSDTHHHVTLPASIRPLRARSNRCALEALSAGDSCQLDGNSFDGKQSNLPGSPSVACLGSQKMTSRKNETEVNFA